MRPQFAAAAVATVLLALANVADAAAGDLGDAIRAEVDRELAASRHGAAPTAPIPRTLGDQIRDEVSAEVEAVRHDLARPAAAAPESVSDEVDAVATRMEQEIAAAAAAALADAGASEVVRPQPARAARSAARPGVRRRSPFRTDAPPPLPAAPPAPVVESARAAAPAPRRPEVRATAPARRNKTRVPGRIPMPSDMPARIAAALLHAAAGGGLPVPAALLAPFFLFVSLRLRRVVEPGSPRPPPGAVLSLWRPG